MTGVIYMSFVCPDCMVQIEIEIGELQRVNDLCVVDDWYKGGGVLLIGYEMYRLLTSRKYPAARGRKSKSKSNDPVVIDLIEEDQNEEMLVGRSRPPAEVKVIFRRTVLL